MIDRRDIDAERARRWRSLLNGDVPDLAVGRHARNGHDPEPPPADRSWLQVEPLRRQRRPRRDWRDSAAFDVLLAIGAGAALLALCVGLVAAVAYTLAWSLT